MATSQFGDCTQTQTLLLIEITQILFGERSLCHRFHHSMNLTAAGK
jgi:hypothetical protein